MKRQITTAMLLLALLIDASATSCNTAADCPTRSCAGDTALVANYVCIGGQCHRQEVTSHWECADRRFCSGNNVMFVDGYCAAGWCFERSAVVSATCVGRGNYCEDGLLMKESGFCTGETNAHCGYSTRWTECAAGTICSEGACVIGTTTTSSTVSSASSTSASSTSSSTTSSTAPSPVPVPEYPGDYAIILVLLSAAVAFVVKGKR